MSVLSEEVAALRAALATEADFSVLFHRFLDLAERPEFVRQGVPARNIRLEGVLKAAADAQSGPAPASRVMLIHCPRLGLHHGSILHGPRHVVFFYFAQDARGLLGALGVDGMFHTTRFTEARNGVSLS